MAKRCVGCMKLKNNSPICEHCGYNENIPNYPHQLPIGTVLRDQYVVGKVLGQGGFGITYIGWDQFLETPVAIKEFYPNAYVSRECSVTQNVTCIADTVKGTFQHNRERFLQEAKVLAKLRNVPGIVRVHNLFSENSTAYIIMEYVEGIDLKRYIRMRGQLLSVEEMLHVMRPVMQALIQIHKADLVHRDISPDNIMIQPDGTAKLLDFGAAREVVDMEAGRELPQSTEAILKHGFAPIEQYRRRGSLGPWTDVYSLCATIYYILTGKLPADAPERMMGDDNVDWAQISGLTDVQRAALEQGMAMLPEKRIASVQELYQALYNQTATEYSVSRSQVHSEAEFVNEELPVQKTPIEDYPVGTLPLEVEPEIVGSGPKSVHIDTPPKFNFQKKLHSILEAAKEKYNALLPNLNPRVKAIGTIALAAVLIFGVGSVIATPKNGWVEKKDNNYYYIDGAYQTGWQKIEGKTYFFDDAGILQTGWQEIEDNTYYLDSDGSMMTGWQTIQNEEYYFDSNGVMLTKWQSINGEQYYFDDSGIMLTGWQDIGSNTYYFNSRGMMQSGWQTIDGKYLFFEEDGAWVSDIWKKNLITYDPLSYISGIDEEDILSVTFLDTTKDAPTDSTDVSKYGSEGKVLAWKEKNGNYYDVYIAADGGINAKDNAQFLFYLCINLEWINFNNCFHTELTTDFDAMFSDCPNLTSLDLSSLDTSNVTTMHWTFDNCDKIKNLNLHNWDVSKVTYFDSFMDDGDTINGRPWKEFFQ